MDCWICRGTEEKWVMERGGNGVYYRRYRNTIRVRLRYIIPRDRNSGVAGRPEVAGWRRVAPFLKAARSAAHRHGEIRVRTLVPRYPGATDQNRVRREVDKGLGCEDASPRIFLPNSGNCGESGEDVIHFTVCECE